ncbi:hypothetical protein LTR10_022772 [Elasticomyces elasticus]|uniref:Uncharacterized protein n=1 Tax=Exophiala sideris TaxID=1016849 RepID=A0ABR0JPY2_9EURO|nr:hypothetical protein LTR10_022772 [Elasticomyces elasticus]KAK5038003.1 hypothetical protein LTS07_001470 [Exophiala sideris]KAK5043985.1 hypothetical protein LTR13_000340 [Exophiala sideris]KAK5067484.1 hypothetical protein LTR69_001472 [Exophiala sideris]KAK5184279.1 hypothetical protein LTR44_003786 [Eurotiomycetes sp. CCFEE 6388]
MNSGPRYCNGPICRAIRSMQQQPADPECEDNQDPEYYSAEEDSLGEKEIDPCLSEASDKEDAIFTPTSAANDVSGQLNDDDKDDVDEREVDDDDADDSDSDEDEEDNTDSDEDEDDDTDSDEDEDEDDADDSDEDEDEDEDDLDDNIPARLMEQQSHARINAWLLTCEW